MESSIGDTNRPTVSVVIPVRDGARYLGAAIESALTQTHPPLEILVLDGGSQDGSQDIVRGFGAPVTLIERPDLGLPERRNLGVAACRGDMISFLDSDDLWAPQKTECQVNALRSERADLVFAHVEEFHSPDLSDGVRSSMPDARGVVPGRVVITLLTERVTLERVGPFDAGLPGAEFLDWLARARDLGLAEVMLPDVLARRRLHESNTSGRWTPHRIEIARALRGSLARRRKDGR